MEEIYANVESDKPDHTRPPACQTGPRSSQRRFHGAAVLFLGLLSLLLLAGIIGLSVHCHVSARDASAEISVINADLSERLSSLTRQRDQLNVSLAETTKELQRLQRLLKEKKTCPPGWKMFGCSCYLFSTQKKSWEKSRQDCRARGADLVVIESFKEQEFLVNSIKAYSWIGLSDRDNEGTWKWTDGAPLTLQFWWDGQPDNGGGHLDLGEEDCAHLRAGESKEKNWNDLRCETSFSWICEAIA
ncbi:C-type lectin domain family 4 member E-like [Halichoeres trimaculatus]|uniref:C-type lectin domain family 4 member E-like n=1 Tax=Halichoeres trimaculatus TaxID=147232 RepID=UPI003D9E2DA6